MSNYDKAYEQIRPWLQKIDAPVELTFLGRGFRVTKEDVVQISGEPVHINAKSIIVWYLTFGGAGNPALVPNYDFVLIHAFSQGIFSDQSTWRKSAAQAKGKLTLDEVRSVAKRLGADFYRKEKYGESYLLFALPKIPVVITFSEGDDEFPSQLDVKFSSNATDFLPFESLAIFLSIIEAEFTHNYGA